MIGKMRFAPCLAVIVSLFLLAEGRAQLRKRPFGWSDSILITHDADGVGIDDDLATDSEGNTWICWMNLNSYHLMLEKHDRRGDRILGPVQVDDGGMVAGNGIGVDPNTGDVFVFWDDAREYPPPDGSVDIYCAKFDADGNKIWGDIRVTYTGFDAGPPHFVVVDSEGAAHAIRPKATRSGATIGYTKVLADGTLKHAFKSVLLPLVSGVYRPELSVDASDHLHVIWGEVTAGVGPIFVQYMKLDNEGDPLVGPIRLSPDESADADLAVDSEGNLHVVWTQFVGYNPPWTTLIYYCKLDNDGTMILPPRQVNQDASTGVLSSILLDHNDRAHILWHQISKSVNVVPWSVVSFAGIREVELDGRGRPVDREKIIFLGHGAWLGWMRSVSNAFGDLLLLNPYYEFFENRHTLELLRTLPQETCRVGAVRLGAGGPSKDVLYVNGSRGDRFREMDIAEGAPIVGALRGLPDGPGGARYIIHANLRAPDEGTVMALPQHVGLSCFDMQLPPYGAASPAAIWNAGAPPNRAGASRYFDGTPIPDPPRAPATFLSLPAGDPINLPSGTVITFQGVIQDRRSASRQTASVTNAVVVKIL